MPRVNATVPPDAIRIEDEVWQEAFARREPGQARSARRLNAVEGGRLHAVDDGRRLQAVDGGRTSSTLEPHLAGFDGAAEAGTSDWLGARVAAPAPPAAAVAGLTAADAASAAHAAPIPAPAAAPTRRTVTIRGRGAEHHLPWPEASRTRPQRRAYERAGFRPDRLAMWAVMLGFLLVLVAIVSAH